MDINIALCEQYKQYLYAILIEAATRAARHICAGAVAILIASAAATTAAPTTTPYQQLPL